MKKILMSLAATAALAAAAAPAAAQDWRGHDYNRGYAGSQSMTSRVDALEWKINNAVQERRISWQDARQLRAELRQVQPLAWKVQNGRANGWEAQRLERTVMRIESAVNRYARNDRYDRDDRYDRGDRYDRDYGYRR